MDNLSQEGARVWLARLLAALPIALPSILLAFGGASLWQALRAKIPLPPGPGLGPQHSHSPQAPPARYPYQGPPPA